MKKPRAKFTYLTSPLLFTLSWHFKAIRHRKFIGIKKKLEHELHGHMKEYTKCSIQSHFKSEPLIKNSPLVGLICFGL